MPEKPVDIIEVSVNDFIGATNNADPKNLLHLSRCMLYGIQAVSPPSEVTRHGGGDSVSGNKLNKGDGTWAHEKEILGWFINGQEYTLRLPAGEKNRKILDRLQNIKKFNDENTKKSHGETCRQPSARIIRHTRGGGAIFAYTGHDEGHQPVAAHLTQPSTMSPESGEDYKAHGKTHHSGPPAGEQLTTLHRVLR